MIIIFKKIKYDKSQNPPQSYLQERTMINALAYTLWEWVFYTQVNIHPCLSFSLLYFLKNVYCFSMCVCHLIFHSYLSTIAHINLPHSFNLFYWHYVLYMGSNLSTYLLTAFQFWFFYSFHNDVLMNAMSVLIALRERKSLILTL